MGAFSLWNTSYFFRLFFFIYLFKQPELAKITATLAASYVGGGENALAMKVYFDISNEIFFSLFAVDNLVTTFWVSICVISTRIIQKKKSFSDQEEELYFEKKQNAQAQDYFFVFFTALSAHLLAYKYAPLWLPIHPILLLTIFAGILHIFKISSGFIEASNDLGKLLFGFFFFMIGARINYEDLSSVSFSVIMLPIFVLMIHVLLMSLFSFFSKIPFCHMFIVSQALIGGPATAAAVSMHTGSKKLCTAGILLGGIGYGIGNIIGAWTYYFLNLIF